MSEEVATAGQLVYRLYKSRRCKSFSLPWLEIHDLGNENIATLGPSFGRKEFPVELTSLLR